MTDPITPPNTLLTVGHSDHPLDGLLALLRTHRVDVVADVRSYPYSKIHAQFNRETLAEVLRRRDIKYVFLGQELGARRAEPECYRNGQADYGLISRLPAFHDGLERLRRGLQSYRVCLLCAEKDPITCHRTVLVCRHLRNDPFGIEHILADGSIETQSDSEQRLLELMGLPENDLFQSKSELIESAYDLQGRRIAYVDASGAASSDGAVA